MERMLPSGRVHSISSLLELSPAFSQLQLPYQKAYKRILENQSACDSYGVLIFEENPWDFLGAFLAALELEAPVFLASAKWRQTEWTKVFGVLSPAIVFGKLPGNFEYVCSKNITPYKGFIMIPTGGSLNSLRFAIHSLSTLISSVEATQAFFSVESFNSYCTLPLHHVSGLMQAIRSLYSKGKIAFEEQTVIKEPIGTYNCTSLVPTQLEVSLKNPSAVQFLRKFDYVFLGGAFIRPLLIQKAIKNKIRICPVYGMTETASMVAGVLPSHLNEKGPLSFFPLPHAEIFTEGQTLAVKADSLFYGYFPSVPCKQTVHKTDDFASLNPQTGAIEIKSKKNYFINTGGEKVNPNEVRDVLLSFPNVQEAIVLREDNALWGEQVIAYVDISAGSALDLGRIKAELKESLADYKVPKEIRLGIPPLYYKKNNTPLSAQNPFLTRGFEKEINKAYKNRLQLKNTLENLLEHHSSIVLEIGCGNGHFLTSYAKEYPSTQCIGIDLKKERIQKSLKKSKQQQLSNAFFLVAEANDFLEVLPFFVKLKSIFILFPDPWPKKRHHKNRLINEQFLEKLALKAHFQARLYFRTDDCEYYKWAIEKINESPAWQIKKEIWPHEAQSVFQENAISGYQSFVACLSS